MIRVESSRVMRRGGARAAAAGGKGMSVKGEKLFSLPVLFMPLWEVRNKLPAVLRMMVREGRPGGKAGRNRLVAGRKAKHETLGTDECER